MIKEIAWNTFKNTGNINTFLEFKNIEEDINNSKLMNNSNENIGGLFGNNKNKGNSNK